MACNRISVQDKILKDVASHYFAMETEVRDIGVKQILKKTYTTEFNGNGTLQEQLRISQKCPENIDSSLT